MRIVSILMMGVTAAAGAAASLAAGAGAETSAGHTVSVIGPPLVMRLSSDEFRIAFGIDGKRCMPEGCRGSIDYRVRWKTADGTTRSDVRRVSYQISPDSGRTIAVDRQYLHTAEGEQTTEVTDVSVERITCDDSPDTSGT